MADSTPATIQGYDPRTGEPAGEPVPAADEAEVGRKVAAARRAGPAWEALGPSGRAAALDAVADALDAHAADLVDLADRETALGRARLTGEVARTTGQLRLFAGLLREGGYLGLVREAAPAPIGAELVRLNRPIGPVAVFAASNFPFAFSVAGGDTASALAAGCPVVVKAHEAHPHTALRTAELVTAALAAAGAPAGTFDLVFGFPAGGALLRHPDLAAAGFTGSTRGGLALAAICAARPVPIPFFGELGSVNPVFVLPGAARSRRDEVAAGYAASLTQGVGQFCTNPGLMFVPDDQALLDAVGSAVAETVGGPMLAERIHAGYLAATASLTARDRVAVLAEGKPGEGPWSATPQVFTTDVAAYGADREFLAEERFGPAGLVVRYRAGAGAGAGAGVGADAAAGANADASANSDAAANAAVEALLATLEPALTGDGQLTATIQLDPSDPQDLLLARALVARLRTLVGRIIYNGWPTGVAVNHAQHHGGPYPATTAPAHTSVGAAAIFRWLIPVVHQGCPPELAEF
ncbi:MAG TPA: aldehyde dehydrogenase family protein [Actinocrinis sp.]|nr:aldehyde dehydrogenase family protein [Actinocrinis sp.]